MAHQMKLRCYGISIGVEKTHLYIDRDPSRRRLSGRKSWSLDSWQKKIVHPFHRQHSVRDNRILIKYHQQKLKTTGILGIEDREESHPRHLYTIDDATQALELMTLALPDNEQELGCQTLQPLHEFAWFPKLPPELRIMIWKHFLPGPRSVELLYDGKQRCFCQGACRCPNEYRSLRQKHPVALFVTRESRSVALSEYTIIFEPILRTDPKPRFENGPTKYRSVSINPKIDQIWIDWSYLLTSYQDLLIVYRQAPELFAKITSLEVRNAGYSWSVVWPIGNLTKFDRSKGGVLALLKGLKTIHFVAPSDHFTAAHPRMARYLLTTQFADIKDVIENRILGTHYALTSNQVVDPLQRTPRRKRGRRFEIDDEMAERHENEAKKLRQEGHVFQMPRIVFHSWRRQQVRSDEDMENDALLTENSKE